MQRKAHQSAFAARLDIGHYEQRLWLELAVLKDADTPGSFSKNHAPVRRPHNRPRHFKVTDDGFNFELRLCLGRTLDFAGASPGRWTATRNPDRDEDGDKD